ncbi:MAG: GspH/FimT family pseudopilin [Candidatus Zixiibacteriota bacterium]
MMKQIKLKSKTGFTLIELMVTVVIIGIVSAMAAPSMERSIQQFKFKSSTKEMLSTLRKARSNAIAEKNPYGVYFNYETQEIIAFRDDANPSSFTYDDGADSVISVDTVLGDYSYLWASFTNSAVVFQPNGTAHESGYIYMYSEKDGSFNSSGSNVLASTGRSKILYLNSY